METDEDTKIWVLIGVSRKKDIQKTLSQICTYKHNYVTCVNVVSVNHYWLKSLEEIELILRDYKAKGLDPDNIISPIHENGDIEANIL